MERGKGGFPRLSVYYRESEDGWLHVCSVWRQVLYCAGELLIEGPGITSAGDHPQASGTYLGVLSIHLSLDRDLEGQQFYKEFHDVFTCFFYMSLVGFPVN